jgi:hypothetical protein
LSRIDSLAPSARQRKRRQAAKTEAEQKALAEQGEYKTLAEQRATELATANQALEAAKTHEQAAEKYKTALLSDWLATDKKGLPAGIVTLIDRLDPIEQAEWLSDPKNADALKPVSPSNRTTARPHATANQPREIRTPRRANPAMMTLIALVSPSVNYLPLRSLFTTCQQLP